MLQNKMFRCIYDEQAGMYEEQPAKATGNNRFDAYPNKNDW